MPAGLGLPTIGGAQHIEVVIVDIGVRDVRVACDEEALVLRPFDRRM